MVFEHFNFKLYQFYSINVNNQLVTILKFMKRNFIFKVLCFVNILFYIIITVKNIIINYQV